MNFQVVVQLLQGVLMGLLNLMRAIASGQQLP